MIAPVCHLTPVHHSCKAKYRGASNASPTSPTSY
jgi:hypothetical protein